MGVYKSGFPVGLALMGGAALFAAVYANAKTQSPTNAPGILPGNRWRIVYETTVPVDAATLEIVRASLQKEFKLESLTQNGKQIVATGTIDEAGTVRPVGSVFTPRGTMSQFTIVQMQQLN